MAQALIQYVQVAVSSAFPLESAERELQRFARRGAIHPPPLEASLWARSIPITSSDVGLAVYGRVVMAQ